MISFITRSGKYKMTVSVNPPDAFSVNLIDEEKYDRWMADFNVLFIENMTRKVGSNKKFSTFWKMLQVAISGTSEEVTFDILQAEDIITMRSKDRTLKTTDIKDNRRYLIITQTTQFDRVHYPLPLSLEPFSNEELKKIILKLSKENQKLAKQVTTSSQQDIIHSLETQLFQINQTMANMQRKNDLEVSELRKQLDAAKKIQDNRISRIIPTNQSKPIKKVNKPKKPQVRRSSSVSSINSTSSRLSAPRVTTRPTNRYKSPGSQRSSASSSRLSTSSFSSSGSSFSSRAQSPRNSYAQPSSARKPIRTSNYSQINPNISKTPTMRRNARAVNDFDTQIQKLRKFVQKNPR